jgi:hypothetical protein
MEGILVPGKKKKLVNARVPLEAPVVAVAPPPVVAVAPPLPDADLQEGDEDRLSQLRLKKEECTKACAQISQELALLEDAAKRNEIASIALSPEKKLIDLLVERVLDPSPDWKTKIDTLINIPNSIAGEGILRGGSYFEALFQLAIAMGELPGFRGPKTFYDIKGYKTKTKLDNYIHEKDVKNAGGGETGIADIMFELTGGGKSQSTDYVCGEVPPLPTTTESPHYFISVKGYRKEKSIAHGYDIPLLSQQLTVFPEIKNRNIMVCVRNKEEFLTRLGRTQQEFLKNSISQVIGYDEVMDAFETYRIRFFLSLPSTDAATIRARVMELFPRDVIPKPMLSMYFHQELIVKSAVKRIQAVRDPGEPHFMCIGVLPRGGKSFIAGGIIDALRKLKGGDKPFNVLFLTSAISETREQFKSDLVEKFAEFSTFTFVDPVRGVKGADKPNKFVFVSRQLSSKKVGSEEEDERSFLEANPDIVKLLTEKLGGMPTFDVCFFDEAHLGIKSESVRENFARAFEQFKMPIVLMSATYSKPARALASDEDLFIWDLQDIRDMRSLPEMGYDAFLARAPDVVRRYPGIADTILTNRRTLGEEEAQIAYPYVNFPSPNFISLTFAPETIKHLRDTGSGYDYARAFEITRGSPTLLNHDEYTKWGGLLTNREDAMRIRQFLTPNQEAEEEVGFLQDKDRKYRALNQIFRIAQKTGSRPIAGVPFSMLMFMPFGGANPPIGELCRIWASFMRESPYWRENFVFLTLSTLTNKKYKPLPGMTPALAVERGVCHREDFKTELKETIRNIERAALEKGKGLVLLSGDVAKMGISLKCVDVVCLMSTNKDADDIIQKMYRALTDDPPYKKNGFIIDLNMKRIITAMFDYAMEKAARSPEKTAPPSPEAVIASVFELCNWGQDAFIEDEAAQGKTFSDIYADIKLRVIDDLANHITLGRSSKVAEKQVELMSGNAELNLEMTRVLKGTSFGKKGAPKPAVMAVRNPDVPEPAGPALEEDGESVDPPPVAPGPVLSDRQIRAKMGDILVTFANALVIRSSEPWKKDTDFASLFAKFLADKATATHVCDCSEETACKVAHTNMYDTAYCELKSYAIASSGSYDEATHVAIVDLVERVFQTPSALTVEWTAYIQTLLNDLATNAPRGGIRRKMTWKKRANKIRHGLRKTYRKRLGNH